MLELDGSMGEGGGQVLRSAIALAVLTQTPLRLFNVRAKRKKPGLLAQHRTALHAAAAISGAEVRGAELGSCEVHFIPQVLVPGHYRFSIGSAGSTTLVLQTVLWPLLVAEGTSVVDLEGGTHNPLAPPFEFFAEVLAPLLHRMGAGLKLELRRPGFYPAGGGMIRMTVEGGRPLRPLELLERGPTQTRVEAVVSNLPRSIAQRELDLIARALALSPSQCTVQEVESDGPGNVVTIDATFAHGRERFTAFGERRKRAESVAQEAVDAYRAWDAHQVPVAEHLADQLLIPLALAGGGRFLTMPPSLHTRTNADVVARFLPVSFDFVASEGGGTLVEVRPSAGE